MYMHNVVQREDLPTARHPLKVDCQTELLSWVMEVVLHHSISPNMTA